MHLPIDGSAVESTPHHLSYQTNASNKKFGLKLRCSVTDSNVCQLVNGRNSKHRAYIVQYKSDQTGIYQDLTPDDSTIGVVSTSASANTPYNDLYV
ncbi:hypothetical protein L3V83_14380 [Thiotrichales bacterium 19X7-9]|nr:hypothetical protein [Thiotrichales bacterium 19X7-9]MCF6777754.1 hypothetical protein [Thiotrichales bacterium 19X7-9]